MRDPIPDWKLERLALGELAADEARALEARLADDPDARARLDALQRSNAEILAAHPPERIVPELRRRAGRAPERRPEPRRAGFWLAAPALAAAAAVALLVLRPAPGADEAAAPDTVRLKGLEPRLLIRRLGDQGLEPLAGGAAARRGDVLQLSYVSAGRRFGAILSIDGRGEVTLHLPEESASTGSAVALSGGGARDLPYSFQLDDAPGFERFFFVTSDHPLRLQPLLDAARALARSPDAARGPLPVPADSELYSLLLAKVAP